MRRSSWVRKRLRSAVFAIVVLAQIATLVVMMVSAYAFRTEAIQDQMALTLARSAESSATSAQAEFDKAQQVVESASELLSLELVEASELVPTFISAMNQNPSLSALYVGNAAGDFDFVGRQGDGFLHKSVVADKAPNNTTLTRLDSNGAFVSRLFGIDTFDPRQRPWYQLAEYDPTIAGWTDPYVFFTSQKLGITVSHSIVIDDSTVGVVGADIELAELSAALTTVSSGKLGGAVIFNDRGAVVAHSDLDVSREIETNGVVTPVQITEVNDPLTLLSVAGLIDQGLLDGAVSSYGYEGHSGLTTSRTLAIGETEWFIVAYGTDVELVPQLVNARNNEVYLALGLGFITLVFGAFAALGATRPLEVLRYEAETDSLTGLPNRRSILTSGSLKLATGKSGLALIDIDHFKLVNDTHGHAVGDQVLVELAERLRQAIRPSDIAGRLGGEEFLIMFDNQGETPLDDLAKRIREGIAASSFHTTAGPLKITVSIGACGGKPGDSFEELVRRSDAALYQAKANGRNCVALTDLKTDLVKSE